MKQYNRQQHLNHFYDLIDKLIHKNGGTHYLSDCHGRMSWPERGVYFFFENGEIRLDTGNGNRIVRVGTHALKSGSKTTLWKRLSQHKGQNNTGGGNHRGSIFRLIVGNALLNRGQIISDTWGKGSSANKEIRTKELSHEVFVSQTIRSMPFVVLNVNDAAHSDSLRGYIERNAIALLSNHDRAALDPPSDNWLGYYCNRDRVRSSGLWNQNHVHEEYDPDFLDVLADFVEKTEKVT
jgi:hypothetical protein